MFRFAVPQRVVVYLVVFILPLLAVLLPSATAQKGEDLCGLVGRGELPSSDFFVGEMTVFSFGTGTGSWKHFTPWDMVERNSCPAPLAARDQVCRQLERLGMSAPGCAQVRQALERNPNCVRNDFDGLVVQASCLTNGSTTIFFAGSGFWNGVPGFDFIVSARDNMGIGPNFYSIEISKGGTIVYSVAGEVIFGDLDATVF